MKVICQGIPRTLKGAYWLPSRRSVGDIEIKVTSLATFTEPQGPHLEVSS